ncbi:hypothetical protein OSB04_024507 [Centaurea solstitialis]|uniref:CRAL-TRIO domain-containing protein n=1 Tax=Centaurea solstitialis TaxID=347529 RepID=A0AA38SL89_9ASTR|nr:hypothetical protein OSB04_024507 [Centaurea solstitialis]
MEQSFQCKCKKLQVAIPKKPIQDAISRISFQQPTHLFWDYFYLKVEFHFDKDQFADLFIINNIAGIISQPPWNRTLALLLPEVLGDTISTVKDMVLMPLLAKAIKEEKLYVIGLFFNIIHILHSIAWAPWELLDITTVKLQSNYRRYTLGRWCWHKLPTKKKCGYQVGNGYGDGFWILKEGIFGDGDDCEMANNSDKPTGLVAWHGVVSHLEACDDSSTHVYPLCTLNLKLVPAVEGKEIYLWVVVGDIMLDVNSTKKKGYGWAVSTGFYAALATISAKFITPQAFINGPWWYFAFYKMINPFFTQRTKSKFVFPGPLPNLKNLFSSVPFYINPLISSNCQYIAHEFVPVQYGALSRESEQEFTSSDLVTDRIIKHATKHTIKFSVMRIMVLFHMGILLKDRLDSITQEQILNCFNQIMRFDKPKIRQIEACNPKLLSNVVYNRKFSFQLTLHPLISLGDVLLKDLKLKSEALNSLKLLVTVKAGFVGSIMLQVGNRLSCPSESSPRPNFE